jgi:hypothetical protein
VYRETKTQINPKREVAMLTKLIASSLLILAFAMGCSSEQPLGPNANQAESAVSGNIGGSNYHNYDQETTFLVRIENVSTTMTLHLSNGATAPAPNSPGVWTITRLFNPLFKIGQYDLGLGMEQQAEDGNPTMLAASMEDYPGVISSGVFNTPVGDAGPGPATPGKAYEFTITARPGDHLSLSSMFGQSNDLFYSPGYVGVALFKDSKPISGDITSSFYLWDAGTEVNQEPGLGSDQAPRQSGPNTGESEHKRVLRVQDEYDYPATDEVIKVTVTPMDVAS